MSPVLNKSAAHLSIGYRYEWLVLNYFGVCEVEQNLGKGGEGSGVEVKIKSVMDNHRQQVDGER